MPDCLDTRDKRITLKSSINVNFKERKSNSEIYDKSPYVGGCTLWKRLPALIQNAKTKNEFDKLLTDDVINTLV